MTSTLRRFLRKERHSAVMTTLASTTAGTWFEAKRERHATVGLVRDFYRDPDQVAGVEERFRPLLNDPAVLALIERDNVPIPADADREGYYGDRHLNYWLSGLDDLRAVRSMIPSVSLKCVLDFGGATGRFARHVALADPSSSVTVADLSLNHVTWCDQHFGPSVRGVKVSEYCHFPLADRSISLCVGLSVFTHIDGYESGWLAEINRVLEVGGHAFLTIHSEHTWPLLPRQPGLLKALQGDPRFVAVYDPSTPMPEERLVYDYMPGTQYHCCNTFTTTEYIRRVWGKWFEIVEIRPQGHHNFQTVVVLRKAR